MDITIYIKRYILPLLFLLSHSEKTIVAQETYRESTVISSYKSYNFDYWRQPIDSPEPYVYKDSISGEDLGIGGFKNPFDIFITEEGELYISDTGNNRVIRLNYDQSVKKIYTSFNNNEKVDSFSSPMGLYVEDNAIYISDSGNNRIVILDKGGELDRIIYSPKSDEYGVIPSSFSFKPIRVVHTVTGKIYAVSSGVYDGLIEFSDSGDFRGFFGAPPVKPNPVDLFWRRFSSKKQRESSVLFLPTEYSSIDLDGKGFLLAIESMRIKRLNPAGEDIFNYKKKDVDYNFSTYGDITVQWSKPSRFVDVAARSNGNITVLDSVRGRIFTYDKQGNLLYMFGAIGDTKALFHSPSSIGSYKGHLYVADQNLNRIIVFKPTEYASAIHRAIDYYEHGKYTLAMQNWEKALACNTNYEMAYTGIGDAKLMNQQYREAMHYFKFGNNKKNYSEAFQLYRRSVLSRYFGPLLISLFLIWGVSVLIRRKRIFSIIKGRIQVPPQLLPFVRGIGEGFSIMAHPFDRFWEIGRQEAGHLYSALFIMLVYGFASMLEQMNTAFVFNITNPMTTNMVLGFLNLIVVFMLWNTVHWALSVLNDGKGTYKQIVMVSGYSLLPLIISSLIGLLLSHILTIEEGSLLILISWTGIIWSAFILFAGISTIQEYTPGKTVLSMLLTIVGIAVVLFLFLLFFSVINLMVSFIVSLYTELVLRF